MPYSRPTYVALLNRIKFDLMAIPAVLRDVLAAMWAQVANGLHGHLDWIALQCSPLTCDLERLADWANVYSVNRLLATAAQGQVVVTGLTGAQLLAGVLARGSNGFDYAVVSAVTIVSGSAFAQLRCVSVGAAGNLMAGQVLTLVDPVAGINGTLTVDVLGITGGSDDESLVDWRGRVVDEWQTITTTGARSGKVADYRFWAKAAHPSVSDALVISHALGIGTVVVRPICNELTGRLPAQSVLDAVSSYIAQLAPATADWRVAAPIPYAVSIQLHLFPAVDTPANRAAIVTAIANLVNSKGSGVQAISWPEIYAVIASVTTQYQLTESVSISWSVNQVPVFGGVVWV